MRLNHTLIFILAGFIGVGCASNETSLPHHYEPDPSVVVDTIPMDIYDKFKEPILKHVGKEFFELRVRARSVSTRYPQDPERTVYYCTWEVRFPESGESMTFTNHMNRDGEVFPKVVELPHCVKDPDLCKIRVTKEEALRIAASAVGQPPSWYWFVDLRMNEAFIWVVVVDLELTVDGADERRFIEINARTGEINRNIRLEEYTSHPPN